MAILTKNQLSASNQSSFPDNTNGEITPTILRNFNQSVIDTLVDSLDTGSFATSAITGSSLITASASGTNVITFTKGNGTTFDVAIATGSGGGDLTSLNAYTQSNDTKWNTLGGQTGSYVTSQITGSSIITASVNNDDITFTKGDGSQFTIQVATGSFAATASLAQDALDIVVNVKNTTGTQINKGTVVRIIGATGDNALIGTASWEDDNNSANTLGFVVTDIPNDAFGRVMTQGTLLSVNTDPALGYTAGQLVYLSGSGQFTNVIPPAPYHEVRLGQVLRAQQNNGSIYVLIQNGYELTELHDVDISTGSLANNNLLAWDSASAQWENKTLTEVGGTTTSSFQAYTGSVDTQFIAVGSSTASLNLFTSSQETKNSTLATYTGSVNTFITASEQRLDLIEDATASLFTSTSLSLTTASFSGNTLTFTKGDNSTFGVVIPDVSGSSIDTGSFATTGSNTFIGNETFQDAGGNFSTLVPTSGSLMLVAKGYNSSSAHFTSSASGKVNIIFKNTNAAASTYISGSNNIFSDTQAPTSGFKRQLGESNINLFLALPQVSASMGDYVNIDNNFLTARNTSPMTIRGPISSSQWEIKGNVVTQQLNIGTSATNHAQGLVSGLLVNNCYIGAGLSIIANRTNTTQQANITNNNLAGAISLVMASSSIDYGNNITAGGTVTINNNSTGSARVSINAYNAALVNSNILGGNTTITFSGSNDPNDVQDLDYNGGVVRSLIHGSGINARVNTGLTGSNTLAGTAIIGNSLTVSGSSQNPITNGGTNLGSAFFGRYNALDGNRASSAQTVFAVGTGTSTSSRKTGFLIDSGSNTFVEGTLNVSGGVFQNVVPITIASSTASLDLSAGTYFTLTLADNATTHINTTNLGAGVSATLVITTGTNSTASLAPTLLQPSGSAYSATVGTSKVDVLSLVSTNASNMFVVSTKNMI